MRNAFLFSLMIHSTFVLLIAVISSFSMKVSNPSYIQLSMEVFNNNEGSGSMAKGIESSNANINMQQNANALQNAQNNIVEKKEEIQKEEKVIDNNLKTAVLKKETVKEVKKNDEKKNKVKKDKIHEKKTNTKQSSQGALMAAKGKAAGDGAGKNGKMDGAPKSKGGADGVYSLKEVDNIPKSLKSVRPVYPEYAKNMRIEGYVQVRFILDDKGRVTNSHVIKAVPDNMFENAALKAVNQWKFKPAKKDGKDVKVAMVVKLNFKLDEK